jgi:hypothetical protein
MVIVKSSSNLMTLKNFIKKISPEFLFSGLVSLVVAIVLALKGSGPIYSDELLYVDIGLNNNQVSSYANRYFHVYLQKLFMSLSPSPLSGTKIFWGFLVALTALLVYWNARSFFKHSQPLHGLLAAAIFFSYHFISEYCGVTSADITAMLMVSISLSLYLLYLRSGRSRGWVITALGAMVFLSFKTKETTLFANIFLIGLFFDQDGKFAPSKITGLVKPFLIGFLSAVGFFILLDGLFLHNPFFSINPQTMGAVFENYAYTGGFRKEPVSYFTTFLLADIMVPFLMYILSGAIHYGREESPSLKIVWLFPLLLAFTMTLNMLKIPWGFIQRFYFPALPVIAILAPQWLRFDSPGTVRQKTLMSLLVLAGIGMMLVLHSSLLSWVDAIQWDYSRFVDSIYQPVLLCLLLGFALVVRKLNWLNVLIPVVCILALLLTPLLYNQKYIFRIPLTRDYFNLSYAPFIAFDDRIAYSPEMRLYFSNSVTTELKMLSPDRNELSAMFNVFFNGRTSQSNFQVGYKPDETGTIITTKKFDYALLSASDWTLLSANTLLRNEVENQYSLVPDSSGKLVLLDRK